MSTKREEPFSVKFIDTSSRVLLEITNTTELQLKCVEILTIFLKDEDTPGGGPSRSHIKFDALKSIQPKEKAVLSHSTWVDGKPVERDFDQLGRLKVLNGETKPYVLDISWSNPEGKTHFQRIPVGH